MVQILIQYGKYIFLNLYVCFKNSRERMYYSNCKALVYFICMPSPRSVNLHTCTPKCTLYVRQFIFDMKIEICHMYFQLPLNVIRTRESIRVLSLFLYLMYDNTKRIQANRT